MVPTTRPNSTNNTNNNNNTNSSTPTTTSGTRILLMMKWGDGRAMKICFPFLSFGGVAGGRRLGAQSCAEVFQVPEESSGAAAAAACHGYDRPSSGAQRVCSFAPGERLRASARRWKWVRVHTDEHGHVWVPSQESYFKSLQIQIRKVV